MEAHSRLSQRKIIPISGCQGLQTSKKKKINPPKNSKDVTCLHPICMLSSMCLGDSTVEFVFHQPILVSLASSCWTKPASKESIGRADEQCLNFWSSFQIISSRKITKSKPVGISLAAADRFSRRRTRWCQCFVGKHGNIKKEKKKWIPCPRSSV